MGNPAAKFETNLTLRLPLIVLTRNLEVSVLSRPLMIINEV